jgi:hypothetical protein
MSRRQHDWRRASCLKGFLPPSNAQAPAITGFKTGKIELRNWRAEIVANRRTESKELLGHNCAYRVQPRVAGTGATIAIAIKSGAWPATTTFQFATENVRKISHGTYSIPILTHPVMHLYSEVSAGTSDS